jgi:uncharacterized membrane protein YgcG
MTPWQFGLPLPKNWKRGNMAVWDKHGPWKLLEAPGKGEYVPVVSNGKWKYVKTKACKKKKGGGGGNGNGGGNSDSSG